MPADAAASSPKVSELQRQIEELEPDLHESWIPPRIAYGIR